MKIAIVHNAVTDNATPDDMDVLFQVESVSSALTDLGYEIVVLPCTLDLLTIKNQLGTISPDLVFNLVENLAGQGRLMHLFPSIQDDMQIPYTG